MRTARLPLAATVAVLLAACGAGGQQESTGPGDPATGTPPTVGAVPDLEVEVVAEGLTLPWDVQLLADGTAVVSERGGRLLAIPQGGEPAEVALDLPDLFTGSEAGLMGLALEDARSVLACYATQAGGSPQDVRVVRLALAQDLSSAVLQEVLVDGMPVTSGRHSGCRLLLVDGTVFIGTGDAADEVHPQSLTSLGGKVLAVGTDGQPLPDAPFVQGADPLIYTYGHRNVQGLALEPRSGQLWSVEHGPDVDDEVNVLAPGGNYGWDPGPGYDERVPMTDLDAFPDAVEAVWSTGRPPHALAGSVFLAGSAWGSWDGALAVAELRGSGVTVLTVDGTTVTGETRIQELDGTYGRLRSLTLGADGSLWVTTSNGEDDLLLRVIPRP